MQVQVSGTNRKGIKALFNRVKKDGHVNVGILANTGKHDDSDTTVAQIGFWHEFGTVRIPERSFIRSTINSQTKEIKAVARGQLEKVLLGETTTENGLGVLGIYTAGLIQEKFTDNDWPQVKPATLKRKTVDGKVGTSPLINTGQLRQSISYEVKV